MKTIVDITNAELYNEMVSDVDINFLRDGQMNIQIELKDGTVIEEQGEISIDEYKERFGFMIKRIF